MYEFNSRQRHGSISARSSREEHQFPKLVVDGSNPSVRTVAVAQLAERQTVTLVVAGSIPVSHFFWV
jgi:hypothetical protein